MFIRLPEGAPAPGSPSDWIDYAESDLALARLALGDQNVMASQICFHAQQAAEKSFKAVLLARHISFPRTHDIDELIELFDQNKIEISANVRNAGRLTPFAVEMRYPGSASGLLEKEVNESIQLAEQVLHWAKTSLSASLKDVDGR